MPLVTLDEAVQAGWDKGLDGLLRFLDAERWRGSWNKTSRGVQLQQTRCNQTVSSVCSMVGLTAL